MDYLDTTSRRAPSGGRSSLRAFRWYCHVSDSRFCVADESYIPSVLALHGRDSEASALLQDNLFARHTLDGLRGIADGSLVDRWSTSKVVLSRRSPHRPLQTVKPPQLRI